MSSEDNSVLSDIELSAGVQYSFSPVMAKRGVPYGVRWEAEPDSKTTIEVQYKGNESLYLTGDFNDWDQPGIPLERTGRNRYRATLDVDPGIYQYKILARSERGSGVAGSFGTGTDRRRRFRREKRESHYRDNTMRRTMKKINLFILAALFLVQGLTASADVAFAQDTPNYTEIVESARNAGIDQARLDLLIQRAQERGVTGEQFGTMMQPAISLANSNLPYEPVLQKVMEGLAKRVPAPQISQVLVRIESGLNRSAVIVDGWIGQDQTQNMIRSESRGRDVQQATAQFRNQLLENSAQALQQNIREEHLASLLNQIVAEQAADRTGLGSVASAVGILGDLPTSETDPELSNRIVISALKAGFSANEMQQLPAQP
jgi:hypothetical protein